MGLEVDIANDGLEAIEAFKSSHYDLIFMDCRMPVMDGYEATRSIRQLEQGNSKKPVPVIALTANASNDDKLLCEQAGMDDVITKPFKHTDLSDCLRTWLPASFHTEQKKEVKSLADFSTIETLNSTIYRRLKEEMDEDFQQVLNAFYASMESILNELENQNKEHSVNDVVRNFHSMKSAASNLGAMRLSKMAATFELNIKDGKIEDLDKSIMQLRQEYEQAKRDIENI